MPRGPQLPFFKEAELACGYPIPFTEINAYENSKVNALRNAEEQKKKEGEGGAGEEEEMEEEVDEVEEEEEVDPSLSALRSLPVEVKKGLKALLLKRAIANIPRWEQVSGDVEGKFRLYRRRIISEAHWNTVKDVTILF